MTVHTPAPPRTAYDPCYDPLVAATPGHNSEYAPTYWLATAGPPPEDDGPVTGDRDADVVVIGSGFTGLACALFLAREHGIKATVVDANRVAWGCSTRNGGQAQNAAGRLTRSQWIARYGEEVALTLHAELRDGFETFSDADPRHPLRPAAGRPPLRGAPPRTGWTSLALESEVANRVFGYATRMLDARRGPPRLDGRGGGGRRPARAARHRRAAGQGRLRLPPRGPAGRRHRAPGQPGARHRPARAAPSACARRAARVRARAVAVATGGYTGQSLPAPAQQDHADPLQLARHPAADARRDRGDRRSRPGRSSRTRGRCATTTGCCPTTACRSAAAAPSPAPTPTRRATSRLLRQGLARKFPALRDIPVEYSWWGWVDVSHDMMPRVVQPDAGAAAVLRRGLWRQRRQLLRAGGAPPRRARRRAPAAGPADLPGELPGHPFAPFRRLGQRMLYKLYERRDEAPDRA